MAGKVAFVGMGGTMAAIGKEPLDIVNYADNDMILTADEIVRRVPEVQEVAQVFTVAFAAHPSLGIGFAEWKALVETCDRLVKEHSDLSGIVIGHGTASLEETAYVLNLTLKVDLPVVLVGSQRPFSALSSDAPINLVNAVRVAASPTSRGRGVMVLLNDEIHAAREVTKTATFRLQAFRAPDFGMLGYVDGPNVSFYRRCERSHAPNAEFDIRHLHELPRVDIAYGYTGADGAAVEAFVAHGARGIVSAGFAPGMAPDQQRSALARAAEAGVVIVQATRAGSGMVHDGEHLRRLGFIPADNLNPQKARILLAMALSVTDDRNEIRRIFQTY